MDVRRLGPGDEAVALALFETLVEVFEEGDGEGLSRREPLGHAEARSLLQRRDFWALAATEGEVVVGGLTAHTLPMTRSRARELFIYDLAVRADRQRRGVGRALVTELLSLARAAGIEATFVAADSEDTQALDFYRAVGGAPSAVTIFTFPR